MALGYLALVLHAHLPFVRHPERDHVLEEEWLYEAITETYIPLLQKFEQLKEDGRMIIPVGNPFSTQQLLEVTKDKGEVKSRNLMFVRFVPFTRSKEEK